MQMKFLSAIVTICLAWTASAETQTAQTDVNASMSPQEFSEKVGELVNAYYLEKSARSALGLMTPAFPHRPPHCDDDGPTRHTDCLETVCEKLGSFGCDTSGEVNDVATLCRGVSASCVSNVCEKLGSFGCDTINEARDVADICRDVFNGDCMREVCGRLGSFGCDTMSEVRQVGGICRGRVDVDCIRSVCDRLGSFGCDTMSELEEVGRTCSGRRR